MNNHRNHPTARVLNAVSALIFMAAMYAQISQGHDCKLADYKNCSRTIDIAVLVQNSTARKALPVIYLAKKDLEEQGLRGPLQNWSISITYKDTKGSNVDATLEAFSLHHNATEQCMTEGGITATENCGMEERSQLDLFLGPVETYSIADVSRLATRWKIPVLSPTNVRQQNDIKKYKYLFQTHGHHVHLATSIKKLWTEWNWTRIHYFSEDQSQSVKGKPTCFLTMNIIHDELKDYNFTVTDNMQYVDKMYDAAATLEEIASKARIVLMCFENRTRLVETMRAIKNLKYSTKDDFVFVFIDVTSTAAEQRFSPSDGSIQWLELNTTEAETFESMFVITERAPNPKQFSEFTSRARDLLNESQEELRQYTNITGYNTCSLSVADISPFVASFYDGVWFFFEAFNETLKKKNYTRDFATELFNEMNEGTFYSRLRKKNYTVMNRSIPVQYSLLNWQRVNNEASFKEVAFIETDSGSFSEQWKPTNETIYWYGENYSWEEWKNSSRPADEPYCGFKDEKDECKENTTLILGLSLAATTVVVIIGIGLAGRKYYKDKQLTRRIWEIPYNDINFRERELHQQKKRSSFPNPIGLMSMVPNGSFRGSTYSYMTASLRSLQPTKNQKIGYYKDERVIVKYLTPSSVTLTNRFLVELKEMRDLGSRNVVTTYGACFEAPNNCLIIEYCSRGSLFNTLGRKELKLDNKMKYSLLDDLVKGLTKLHSSKIKYHGNLKSTNCVINSQFVLKVTDFGLLSLRSCNKEEDDVSDPYNPCTAKLWSAPERLRMSSKRFTTHEMKQADIYSLGIIINEVLTRKGPFPLPEGDSSIKDYLQIVENVKRKYNFRPAISTDITKYIRTLIEECWEENYDNRPQLSWVKTKISQSFKEHESGTLMDNLLVRMEHNSHDLERTVEQRTNVYLKEKQNCENLLYQLLPPSVTQKLISGQPVEAESFNNVSIYFSDIVGFTALSAESTPMQVVEMLNELYYNFDRRLKEFDVYKVETIGDAYMVVSGLPMPNSTLHAREIARMALALLAEVRKFKIPHRPEKQLQLRIGVHSGPCVAGVVGQKMPRYCLFGDTVNTASRMESSGLPMKIHISSSTYDLLHAHYPQFQMEYRQQIEIKGKGLMNTYWLKGKTYSFTTNQRTKKTTSNNQRTRTLRDQGRRTLSRSQTNTNEVGKCYLATDTGLRRGGSHNFTTDKWTMSAVFSSLSGYLNSRSNLSIHSLHDRPGSPLLTQNSAV